MTDLQIKTKSTELQAIQDQQDLAVKAKTYTDLILSKSMRLESITTAFGQETTLLLVLRAIGDLCGVMSFDTSPKMIGEVATMILDDYPDTKLAAFQVFKKEVLYGRIGKPGKTFRMDAKVLLEYWDEFYKNMSNEIADFIEREHYEQKQGVTDGMAKALKAAPAWVGEKIIALEQKKRIEAIEKDRNRPKPKTAMALQELCEDQGLDYANVIDNIREKAETDFAGKDIGITFETFLAIRVQAAEILARKDINHLKSLETNQP